MHDLEPYNGWHAFYNSSQDPNSPFYEKVYNYDLYSETIYGYYIDPAWDNIGSETLFIKVLYANYEQGIVILEFIGEWNDALHNDIMVLKRNILEHFISSGIRKFLLVGEFVMNFHGSDDAYYEEWFEEVEEGWIAALNFRAHVTEEWEKFNLDEFIVIGQDLMIDNWRTKPPLQLMRQVEALVRKRLG
ncbi:hypothetical protein [Persicobacter sp. CCB-QB2]|uniref:hypothetical protein n=1 Tax=Persicobacter sp. CCB-QB2 TaxID=1561025 RepID=UPI0006A9BF1F|nr:hypothetical protein [Persicobacter sp. CCB-QB2]